jgi:hypothetical protein
LCAFAGKLPAKRVDVFGAKNEEVRRNVEKRGLTASEPARQAWPSDTEELVNRRKKFLGG